MGFRGPKAHSNRPGSLSRYKATIVFEPMKTFTVAVIAGDGVGTEVIPQAKRVLEKIAQKHDVSDRKSVV